MGAVASGTSRRDWLASEHRDTLATKIVLLVAVSGSVLLARPRFVVDAVTNGPVLAKMSLPSVPLVVLLVIALFREAFGPGPVLDQDVQGLV
jgi:ABC-type molybdate transport system permease subunit